ncbi:allophanate hydrolase [Chromohalobacter sarecensis]|uniref:Allophanate hydrolase n=1 Tax=Chromohalobacter sarecensis TaxID=245294 RepID=A0ABV9D285_9GAMM|nr:allophanate hydrolase [Chromohalobacter sarecensis]MCK0714504.1 allophanate hydrolase [Chromohalobacter sarecensis]
MATDQVETNRANETPSSLQTKGWALDEWRHHQRDGKGLARLGALIEHLSEDDPAWIELADRASLERQWQALETLANEKQDDDLPLYGVPFAVKDNIDAAGWKTTAACEAFAHCAEADATVVARLRAAGAILVGKTNLDQFATGLVGTRSPWGAVPNTHHPDYVAGGSSAGSASVVARGLVPFALGTDTAGSGRVPAGFNNIVGLKPTRGWLSTKGVVPACRTLDCVSAFALTVDDAWAVAEVAGGYDEEDPYARCNPMTAPVGMAEKPRLAIPETLEFCGDTAMQAAFEEARERLSLLAEMVTIDFSPFQELAALLYQGPWVAERTHAVAETLEQAPASMDPSVRTIVASGYGYSALDYFAAEYRRAELARHIQRVLADVDALVVPTSPTIRTLVEMAEEPIAYNSEFGTYTNFTNLADLSALALPAAFRDDGLPAGITLIAPAWHDRALATFGKRWQQQSGLTLGATGRSLSDVIQTESFQPIEPSSTSIRLAVVGAHLRGMPLNFQLTTRNAVFIEATHTAPDYRLYALANTTPPKPGLARDDHGAPIEVELWDVPLARFGEFVAEIPSPLGIGSLVLADGRVVKGFICEPWAIPEAKDITSLGGWRAYIASLSVSNDQETDA